MSEMVTRIEEQLQATGINKTFADVRADFLADPELSPFVTGLDDEAVADNIFAQLSPYISLYMNPLPDAQSAPVQVDPTATVPGSSKPMAQVELSPQQSHAMVSVMNQDAAVKQERSKNSAITAVLISLPAPESWVHIDGGVLPVKGGSEAVAAKMQDMYQPDVPFAELKTKKGTYIPTTEQLAELWASTAKPTSGKVVTPQWVDFNNTAAYANIAKQLGEGAMFTPFIAPMADEGTGADKKKGWRWNTRGFCLRVPAEGAGAGAAEDRYVTKEQLLNLLAVYFNGYIPAQTADGLSCQLASIAPKAQAKTSKAAAGASEEATALKPVMRVKNNNPTYRSQDDLIPVNQIDESAGPSKMTMRSEDAYFVMRVKEGGIVTVSKQRVPLVWDGAPTWVPVPAYQELFPNTKLGTPRYDDPRVAKSMRDAALLVTAQLVDNVDKGLGIGYDTTTLAFVNAVNQAANNAQLAIADEISI